MSKEKPADGLFTVNCSNCCKLYPAENRICVCGDNKGELNLDIDKMLNKVYELTALNKIDRAIDIVLDVFWDLYNKFDIMNNILKQTDVSKLNAEVLVSFLTQTFKYAEQVPEHNLFCDRVANRLRETGYTEDKIHRLVDDFRDVGNYWENMDKLQAPAWLSGPKPKK